jgi:acyl-CoA dehydrogenase
MAFLKSLIKEHGKQFFEPIGRAIAAKGLKNPNPMNPAHAWALKDAMMPYARWRAGQFFSGRRHVRWPEMPDNLKAHAEFANQALHAARLEISEVMTKHQLKLADRQCRMAELSQRIQDMTVMLAASLWAAKQPGQLSKDAADVLCQDLARKLTGRRPSDRYFRAVAKLGKAIDEGGYEEIAGIPAEPILMTYAAPEAV